MPNFRVAHFQSFQTLNGRAPSPGGEADWSGARGARGSNPEKDGQKCPHLEAHAHALKFVP